MHPPPPPPRPFHDPRLTEQRNPRSERIDVASSLEIVDLINAEDQGVPAAVRRERETIARAIDLAVAAIGAGGRLLYLRPGPPGPLAVHAASCHPPPLVTPPP